MVQIHCSSVEAYLPWKCCCYVTLIAWDILFVMSSVTGNLCNKCPKQLVEQNSSYSDYFNAISGFTSNSRAPGGPVTFTYIEVYIFDCPWQSKNLCNGSIFKADRSGQIYIVSRSDLCKVYSPIKNSTNTYEITPKNLPKFVRYKTIKFSGTHTKDVSGWFYETNWTDELFLAKASVRHRGNSIDKSLQN